MPDFTQAPVNVREQVADILGQNIAERVCRFDNDILYVSAGAGPAIFAWLIDAIIVWGPAALVGYSYFSTATEVDAINVAMVLVLFTACVVAAIYGLFYRNGRGLGALLMGTRLMRVKDGGRVGFLKGSWAMILRIMFTPLYLLLVLLSLFDGAPGVGGNFRLRHTSIDDDATRKLWAAGFHHL